MFAAQRNYDTSSFKLLLHKKKTTKQRNQAPRRAKCRRVVSEAEAEAEAAAPTVASISRPSAATAAALCELCDSETSYNCQQCDSYLCSACVRNASVTHRGHDVRPLNEDREAQSTWAVNTLEARLQRVVNTPETEPYNAVANAPRARPLDAAAIPEAHPREAVIGRTPGPDISETQSLGAVERYGCSSCEDTIVDKRYECQDCNPTTNYCEDCRFLHYREHRLVEKVVWSAEDTAKDSLESNRVDNSDHCSDDTDAPVNDSGIGLYLHDGDAVDRTGTEGPNPVDAHEFLHCHVEDVEAAEESDSGEDSVRVDDSIEETGDGEEDSLGEQGDGEDTDQEDGSDDVISFQRSELDEVSRKCRQAIQREFPAAWRREFESLLAKAITKAAVKAATKASIAAAPQILERMSQRGLRRTLPALSAHPARPSNSEMPDPASGPATGSSRKRTHIQLLDFEMDSDDYASEPGAPVPVRRRACSSRRLWSSREKRQLQALKDQGWPTREIARLMRRSVGAVRQQWRKQVAD